MKINNLDLHILENNYLNQYKLMEAKGSKEEKIASYMVHNISPFTNRYQYNIKNLCNIFNCSHRTIYRAIKILKKTKYANVTSNYISLNDYHKIQESDDNND